MEIYLPIKFTLLKLISRCFVEPCTEVKNDHIVQDMLPALDLSYIRINQMLDLRSPEEKVISDPDLLHTNPRLKLITATHGVTIQPADELQQGQKLNNWTRARSKFLKIKQDGGPEVEHSCKIKSILIAQGQLP